MSSAIASLALAVALLAVVLAAMSLLEIRRWESRFGDGPAKPAAGRVRRGLPPSIRRIERGAGFEASDAK